LALEGEDRPEEAEVDLDRLVDVHRPREARAAREDRTDHLDSACADALEVAVTNDPPVRPFAGTDLGVSLPRVVREHVEEDLRIRRIVRPSFPGVARNADAEPALFLAFAHDRLQHPPPHWKPD